MNEIINLLKEKYEGYQFDGTSIKYGEGHLHAFFIQASPGITFETTWEGVRNTIGVYFQSKLESQFEIWNIYLFFLSSERIDRDLKHKIEHDTVSSRKIVLDEFIAAEDYKNILLEQHITNSALIIDVVEPKRIAFAKNKAIATIIDRYNFSAKKRDKDKFLDDALGLLEKSLPNEN